MKGYILDFNFQEGKGLISGDDGKRYEFELKEWKEHETPVKGERVDFEISPEGKAIAIYKDPSSKSPISKPNKAKYTKSKNRIVAFLLAFFFGGLGIHKFYLGCPEAGAIMLVVWLGGWIFHGGPTLAVSIVAFIEAITYLTKSDEEFYEIYVKNKKCWF